MSLKHFICLAFITCLLVACAAPQPTAAPTTAETEAVETASAATEIAITEAITAVPTDPTEFTVTPATPTAKWINLPVVPEVSPAMIEVFERGLAAGREPNRFSKIGDCQNITTYFLAMYDGGTYRLGDEYAYLQPTIDYFAGSWARKSLAVKGGLNVIAVQNPMWTAAVEQYTKKVGTCKKGETPLVCELRDNNPSFALISMEESWAGSYDLYDINMRQIVEYVLSLDIVPILATRTETLTQDRQINDIIVQIAEDYQVPLWNFGASVASLPDAGKRDNDEFHLTEGRPFFDDPEMMTKGWPWRNLTALQALDAVSRGVGAQD